MKDFAIAKKKQKNIRNASELAKQNNEDLITKNMKNKERHQLGHARAGQEFKDCIIKVKKQHKKNEQSVNLMVLDKLEMASVKKEAKMLRKQD